MIDNQKQLPRPLGDAQCARRHAEQSVRSTAVELSGTAESQARVAAALQIAPQTLSSWKNRDVAQPLRGRRRIPVDPLAQNAVVELLDHHGTSIGIPALKALHTAIPRSRLRDIRDAWVQRQSVAPHRLCWKTPGAVWSTDFTKTNTPIDGCFPHLLIVRDLASRCTILAYPCIAQSAHTVVARMRELFEQHGPPLVLKSDNGGPFIADVTRQLYDQHRVTQLLSPPLTPQYNGSVEATAGQLKTRAAILAELNECQWTSDIIETARITTNVLLRPWGISAHTPAQRWENRSPIKSEQRQTITMLIMEKTTEITRSIQTERLAKGLDPTFTAACTAAVARTAIRRALVELGHLQVRRPADMST
jgi:transposase InsO family protein